LAYERDKTRLGDALWALGFSEVERVADPATNTQGYFTWGQTPAKAYLVFRGTEKNFADILTDLKFRKEPLGLPVNRINVHRGFKTAFNGVYGHCLSRCVKLWNRGFEIEAVGHSLGGALAILAGYNDLADYVTTFGAPRVGNTKFATVLSDFCIHRRYVHDADIVPRVPFLALGFRHDGPALFFDYSGQLHADAGIWKEMSGLVQSYLNWDFKHGNVRAFTDHRIGGYIDCLENLITPKGHQRSSVS